MFRSLLKRLYVRLWVLPQIHRKYRSLPLKATFQEIYSSKGWGDNGTPFCSGEGSHGPVSRQYCDAVVDFIRDHQVRRVVDLGCGDFAVGRQIVEATGVEYIGIDVVPELIEHHNQTVNLPGVSFRLADITSDPLPAGDLCLVRQVLQHLSNEEIAKVLINVKSFPMVLVAEDVPAKPRSINRDKPHGPDVRGYYRSGVYLDQPPFSIAAKELWSFNLRKEALLRTVLIDRRNVISS